MGTVKYTLTPNHTLHQKIVNKLMELIKQKAVDLGYEDIRYNQVYLIDKGGGNFDISEKDKTYSFDKKEVVPIIFGDFMGKMEPQPGDYVEISSVNLSFILSDNEGKGKNTIATNLEIIEALQRDLNGGFFVIDTYSLSTNSSVMSNPTPPSVFAGKHRVQVDMALHYQASQNLIHANQIEYYLDGEKVVVSSASTGRAFIAQTDQTTKQTDSTTICKESVWTETWTFRLKTGSDLFNKIELILEDSPSSNEQFSYKKISAFGTILEKIVVIEGANQSAELGGFVIVTITMKKSGVS